jgi:hypothetical protein
LNTSLSDTKGELENFKFAMAREKTMRSQERKQVGERDTKIIQNVGCLQAKLKVFPTLEHQLRQADSSSANRGGNIISASTRTQVSAHHCRDSAEKAHRLMEQLI